MNSNWRSCSPDMRSWDKSGIRCGSLRLFDALWHGSLNPVPLVQGRFPLTHPCLEITSTPYQAHTPNLPTNASAPPGFWQAPGHCGRPRTWPCSHLRSWPGSTAGSGWSQGRAPAGRERSRYSKSDWGGERETHRGKEEKCKAIRKERPGRRNKEDVGVRMRGNTCKEKHQRERYGRVIHRVRTASSVSVSEGQAQYRSRHRWW